jgi:hypothetical protein
VADLDFLPASEPLTHEQRQAVFDFVARHLLRQGRQCMGAFSCALRSGGLSCAVGCLIPDSRYRQGLEEDSSVLDCHGEPNEDLLAAVGVLLSDIKSWSLLDRLQIVHDDEFELWNVELGRVAGDFGLSKAVLE